MSVSRSSWETLRAARVVMVSIDDPIRRRTRTFGPAVAGGPREDLADALQRCGATPCR
jgi:hypothetical protein